jgi:hypothetical protein
VQSVPITIKVVSSNPVHGKVYLIQHYVIKFVSDLRQVSGFLRVLRFPPPIKLTNHDITEILLKVALHTINQSTIIITVLFVLIDEIIFFLTFLIYTCLLCDLVRVFSQIDDNLIIVKIIKSFYIVLLNTRCNCFSIP